MNNTNKEKFEKMYASLDKIDERDKLARELAGAVLLQHSPVGGVYGKAHDCIMCEQARQLLKLYEGEG
ncbi:hypothetical protein LCGC14_2353690 [marine sediment metagenome]|uniref:Uncharacterized protein n=1 Tax=marine sediment metagenome TaxID=412755 RepID=A0A0F9F3C3_9ZZZZ